MKAVMLSIQPKWVDKIIKGEKTIEVRKNRPKLEPPFKCYIYMSQGNYKDLFTYGDWIYENRMKVVGEFVCDKIFNFVQAGAGIMFADENLNQLEPQEARDMTCLADKEIADYLGNKDGYGLHISDLKIYDKPKELGEFKRPCIMPEEPYCPCCKHGSVIYSEDEIEYALYHGGYCDTSEWVCHNCVKRPPQSWCYVEEDKKSQ